MGLCDWSIPKVYGVEEEKKPLEEQVYIKVSSDSALMISSFGAH
jgi:hypothetical protein